ncbi:MAG: glutamine amidotransferase [Candidatus Brocadiia bacterium]
MNVIYWLLGLRDPGSVLKITEWAWYAASSPALLLLVVITIVALAVAALNLLPQNVMPWTTRFSLTLMRIAGFALLVLMLAQVELGLTVHREARPRVAMLTDISGSMSIKDGGGEESRLWAANAFANEKVSRLAEQADVARYSFNWQVTSDEENQGEGNGTTHLIEAIEEVARREKSVDALILLTDGHDTVGNTGRRLSRLLAARGLPVYPVIFGKSEKPRIARVRVTEGANYVRLGDETRLAARVTSEGVRGQTVAVHLFEEGKEKPVASRENVRIGKGPVEVNFVVQPTEPGPRTYRIVLKGVRESVSERTLVATHRLNVIDKKIRVLYVDIPRDERKILGHWLTLDPVVDFAALTLMPKGGWYGQGALQHEDVGAGLPNKEADLYKYDVILFGDIPRSYFRHGGDVAETKMRRLVEFVSRRGGGIVTLGGRDVYAAGGYEDSPLARILPFRIEPTKEPQIKGEFSAQPTAIGFSHPIMQLEWHPRENRDVWYGLARLNGCNRVGELKPSATLLAERKLENETFPVIAIHNVGKGKVLGMTCDTTWRWEMMRPPDSEDYFRKFWGNVVRYLAPDPRLSPHRPQIMRYQSRAAVGERVTLATRLVNDVYEPVRNADLLVKVRHPSGSLTKIYPRDGRDSPGLYEYEIDVDEPGIWTVETVYNDATTTEKIRAGESTEEMEDPTAKPDAMNQFARTTGGKAFTPQESEDLLNALDLERREYVQRPVVAVWNLPIVLLALLGLVCMDCFIRKRRGMV